jgi:hypothetical protein
MSTEAQAAANKANAQYSTGPRTLAYDQLRRDLTSEHKPTTFTEKLLVDKMAQHHWLRQRALELQNLTLETTGRKEKDMERSLALYLRYQTSNERAFHKCLNDLLKLRAETRKQEIGFESQQRAKEEHACKQAIESRKQDLHKSNVWLAEAKAEHQELLNHRLETPETRMPNRVERILARTQAA